MISVPSRMQGLQDKIKLVPIDLGNRPAWYKEKVYPENKVTSSALFITLGKRKEKWHGWERVKISTNTVWETWFWKTIWGWLRNFKPDEKQSWKTAMARKVWTSTRFKKFYLQVANTMKLGKLLKAAINNFWEKKIVVLTSFLEAFLEGNGFPYNYKRILLLGFGASF